MSQMTLPDRLKALRARAGMTQEQVAREIGVSSITISRYERGAIESPDVEVLRRLAHVYGSTLDWMLGREPQTDESRVEVDVPESFRVWRETMAPADLSPQAEERMLQTHFRFPPQDAYRWGQVYDLVMAELRGRRSSREIEAEEQATQEADRTRKTAGLRKLPPKKKSKKR